jgi:hypothetical protein
MECGEEYESSEKGYVSGRCWEVESSVGLM